MYVYIYIYSISLLPKFPINLQFLSPHTKAPGAMPLIGPALIGNAGAGTTIHRQVRATSTWKSGYLFGFLFHHGYFWFWWKLRIKILCWNVLLQVKTGWTIKSSCNMCKIGTTLSHKWIWDVSLGGFKNYTLSSPNLQLVSRLWQWWHHSFQVKLGELSLEQIRIAELRNKWENVGKSRGKAMESPARAKNDFFWGGTSTAQLLQKIVR